MMCRMSAATVTVSRHVNAAPEAIYGMVSDLPRMGEWSPENCGGTWLGGANGAAVGARFKGRNENGKKRWTTMVKIAICDAPTTFAFDVSAVGFAVARWQYDIVAEGDGSLVTESFFDHRNAIAKLFGGPASGVKERHAHNRAGMEHTLTELATAAEAATRPS
ncbi:MAG: Polyketide cyclase / dehydrase and lipid transport [Ilumatobacteraceae bacterium]|nr:Polyketide cyclase / dehydrase and lipid transport [Ilumatobacteraceae bacterium]